MPYPAALLIPLIPDRKLSNPASDFSVLVLTRWVRSRPGDRVWKGGTATKLTYGL